MNARPFVSVAAALILAGALAGCSKTQKVSGPTGDTGGEHLLVFRTDRASSGQFDVALFDLDQRGFRSVAGLNSTFDESEPCLSNDGYFVTFASNRSSGLGGYDVYVYDRQNQVLLPTPNLNSAADETAPRFSYDSVHLAFVRDSAGLKRVRLYEPLGDSLVALPGLAANGPFDDVAPAPDLYGNRIAFQTNRSGRWHVEVWDRATKALEAVAGTFRGDSNDVEPALTADGRWLAFASNRSGGAGGYDLYVADLVADTVGVLAGANTSGDERHPTISADGRTILFQSRPDAGSRWGIWRYSRADGTRSQFTNLTTTTTSDDTQPYTRWR